MVTVHDVRAFALTLPRAYEAVVRDRVKFRVGRIVFLALSREETELGFGYPKQERDALIAAEPATFHLPIPSNLRYHWVECWLAEIELDELHELILDAWRMVVPKMVWNAYISRTPRWSAALAPPRPTS